MSGMGYFNWNVTLGTPATRMQTTIAKYGKKFLAPHQKEAVIRAVQNDPNCTGNTVIRNMRNVADERVQIGHSSKNPLIGLYEATGIQFYQGF